MSAAVSVADSKAPDAVAEVMGTVSAVPVVTAVSASALDDISNSVALAVSAEDVKATKVLAAVSRAAAVVARTVSVAASVLLLG
mmetsp:Transcript_87930/g.233840  ORF Transcript_87930/g.233840 Transcript_87930/m.233840 type:complete len:84 (+) Transcript_87930:730-981(+)